jgi:GntR family transcriptional regulator, transcriptional repressor for pyruvate dehydrogenase complex
VKAYEVVLAHIENGIIEGTLREGSPLPSERDLAVNLKVSRTAVREAIRSLEAQGLITSSVGAGPDGGTRIAASHSRALGKLLRLHVALGLFPYDDVVEARITLERSSAALAARHATTGDKQRLRAMLTAMSSPNLTIETFNELDTDFHLLIASLSHNQLVGDLTSAVRESLRRPIREASEGLDDWEGFRQDLMRQHGRIYEAIASGDPDLAATVIESHIRTAYAILPLAPEQGGAAASARIGQTGSAT